MPQVKLCARKVGHLEKNLFTPASTDGTTQEKRIKNLCWCDSTIATIDPKNINFKWTRECQDPEVNINLKHGLPKQKQNEEGDQNIAATQHHSAQQEQHNVMPVDHRMQKLISI